MLANLGGSIIYDVECAVGYHGIPGPNVILFVLIGPCLLLAFIEQLREKLPGRARDPQCREEKSARRAAFSRSDQQGGDEFTVVLADVGLVADVVSVAAKIMALSGTTAHIEDMERPLSVSLGIALYPDDASDFDSLLHCADAAMYRAKAAGRNGYRFLTHRSMRN
jgi:GGDEF domain-containing protein